MNIIGPNWAGRKKEDLEALSKDYSHPAHERIGALFSLVLQSLESPEELRKYLSALGVHPNDTSAQRALLPLLKERFRINYDANHTVFYLKKGKETVGVFKIGRKRASIELLARQIGLLTGLSNHLIPGLFCAIENFKISDEPQEEALWNGLVKVYTQEELDREKTQRVVIGILQPFLPKRERTSLYEYTLMTLTALVIGLRDGKSDGYCGSTLFDIEDAFPIYIDPPEGGRNSVAATDLPYLAEDERTTQLLSEKEVLQLQEIVRGWDLEVILGYLSQAFIDHADTISEGRSASEVIFYDEGGNAVCLEPQVSHFVNGSLNHWEGCDRLCLFPSQVEATRVRLMRARDFILSRQSFTPLDLVFSVDPWAQQLSTAIASSPTKSRAVRECGSVDPLGLLSASRCTPMEADLLNCIFTPPGTTVGEPTPQTETPLYDSFTEIEQSCFPGPK